VSRSVGVMDYNRTASEPSPWPYSGRGEHRPQTARAARTNDPLALPKTLRGRGQSPQGRRWRDLARAYSAQLGPERMQREDVRARLRNLIWLTIELERLHDTAVSDRPPIHTLLHMTQEQRVLLAELGLCDATRSDAPRLSQYLEQPDGHDHD
jgi:hypothetical protein